METHLASPDALLRPWRRATVVASTIAAVELLLLVGAGVVLIARPLARHERKLAAARPAPAPEPRPAHRLPGPISAGVPKLSRTDTSVLVLNGNGRAGSAGTAAAAVRALGYMVSAIGNASRHDYGRSTVMYRPGYRAEAARLARDLRVPIYGPLDGLRPADLLGAQLALVVGTR